MSETDMKTMWLVLATALMWIALSSAWWFMLRWSWRKAPEAKRQEVRERSHLEFRVDTIVFAVAFAAMAISIWLGQTAPPATPKRIAVAVMIGLAVGWLVSQARKWITAKLWAARLRTKHQP